MPIAEQLITEHLDTWSSTIKAKSSAGRGGGKKQELYGIKKLRGLILELAVRGLLVPQDSNDKSAKNDLELFIKNRDSSKLKITKVDDTTEAAEIDIPKSWLSVSLGEVVSIRTGFAFKSKDYADRGTFILRVTNINADGSFDTSNSAFLADTDLNDKMQGFQLEEGELLVVMVGGSLGKIGQVTSDILPALLNQNMWRLKPYSVQMNLRFLRFVLYDLNENRLQITKSTHGHLAMGTYAAAKVPFPPLAEQHRIVAKVDELMALCDQLEQQQTDSIAAHETLVTALLGALTSLSKQGQFESAWQRIAANFDSLFTTESSIDQLKQTILQLAVMGKLVPQDPNDESVDQLLVSNDKQRNDAAESDRRASRDQQPLLSSDDRWPAPDTWRWRGLADLVLFVDYRGKTPTKIPSGVRLLTAKNVRKGIINLKPEEFLSESDYHKWMTRGFPKAGDVLFTTEAPMGNAAVIQLTEQFALAQRVICFQSYGALDTNFLALQLLSKPFQLILSINGTGMTAKGIKASKLKKLPITIPPVTEQRSIVAKVDELMALCDALKVKLKSAQSTQLNLADTLVEKAIS